MICSSVNREGRIVRLRDRRTLPKSGGSSGSQVSRSLVETAKLRWRIERDYQELKQEVGLGHSRDAAGAAFIIMQRCASRPIRIFDLRAGDDSPSGARRARPIPFTHLPTDYRPRICHCGPNVMFQIRSRRCDGGSNKGWFEHCEMSLLRNQVRPLHKPSLVTQ
jgi:hypothetical protein